MNLKINLMNYLISTKLDKFMIYFSEILNRPKIHNRQEFLDVVEYREKNRGLLTVSNHYSCIDDPVMWGKY